MPGELHSAKLNGATTESFSVEILYRNIDNEGAVENVMGPLVEHRPDLNLFGFQPVDLKMLMRSCLNCSIFGFNGSYFEQKRGIDMGTA